MDAQSKEQKMKLQDRKKKKITINKRIYDMLDERNISQIEVILVRLRLLYILQFQQNNKTDSHGNRWTNSLFSGVKAQK